MISDRLANLLRRELNLGTFDFTDSTKAYDVPGWDSLKHVEILAAVEQEYGVRFRAVEILRLKSIGDLQALIDSRTGAK
ncbi:MAG TPA: acyl carrier protein [Gemmatimonadaceae bacterium]|jgi:acyl carrier protein|nr:acyl carrier protein [Gemmatimonadaceae bacterium]